MGSSLLTYGALLAVKHASRALYTVREEWVGDVPSDPWADVRLIAVLNHTSLAEGIYLAAVPNRVLKRVARHAVLPVAQETMERPIDGWIFRTLVANAVPITRKRDHSWTRVLSEIDDPQSMVTLFPEGRMMRPTGLDKKGAPMTVKPGIADVILGLERGRMIIAYSGGLHHVFKPGASFPKFFRVVHLKIESLDIADYIAERKREGWSFSSAVVRDLTRRRDLHTPIAPGTPSKVRAEIRRRRNRMIEALKKARPSRKDARG